MSGTRRTAVRASATSPEAATKPTVDLSTAAVVGVRISHPDRLIYPDLGISKIQLARYYEEIADWIVPHLVGRPLTLVHCPAGVTAPCMYLKHAKAWGPSALRRVKIQEKAKVGEYLVADSIEAVASLAQHSRALAGRWSRPLHHKSATCGVPTLQLARPSSIAPPLVRLATYPTHLRPSV